MPNTLEPLWKNFYDENPFSDFPLDEHPQDLQGWGSTHPVFEYLIDRLEPQLIVEVGTWKGKSAIHMGRLIKRMGLDCQLLCIDTWLGAPEHILRPEYFSSLRMANGYPQLFHTFMSNVIREGLADIITPLPQTSENAAEILRRRGLRADLIYIDAAHEYRPVLRDLEAYTPLLTQDGLLLGDDYPKAPGVVRAAHEFATRTGKQVAAEGGKFLLVDELDSGLENLGFELAAPQS